MKAIVNIKNKKNQYAKFNGLTFEVTTLLNGSVGLKGVNEDFPNNETHFSFDEIVIVDIAKEMQRVREAADWYGENFNDYEKRKLDFYCMYKLGRNIETKFIPAQ